MSSYEQALLSNRSARPWKTPDPPSPSSNTRQSRIADAEDCSVALLPIGTDKSPKTPAPAPAVFYFRPHGKYPKTEDTREPERRPPGVTWRMLPGASVGARFTYPVKPHQYTEMQLPSSSTVTRYEGRSYPSAPMPGKYSVCVC